MNTRSFINKQNRDRLTKGYTMAEVLMVVAIMGILAAVAFLGIFALRRNMKQTQADKNAEIIFEAAQRQMVSLVAFDADGTLSMTSKNRTNGIEAPVGIPGVNADDYNMLAAEPGQDRDTLQALLLEDQVSDDLYNGGWIVEYDNTSLQVKSVFYYEKAPYTTFYNNTTTNADLRSSRAKRLQYQKDNKYAVGYYDGSTSSVKNNKLKVYGVVQVENKEELLAKVAVCATGEEAKDKDYILTITTTGVSSGAKTVQQIEMTDLMMDPWTKMRTGSVTISLDSLKEGKQFKDTYGAIGTKGIGFLTDTTHNYITINGSGTIIGTGGTIANKSFIPGEDVEITVSAETEDHAVSNSLSEVNITTNSLYASMVNDHGSYTAKIAYGRHLQNLDLNTSGMSLAPFRTATIATNFTDMKAIQIEDIDFGGDWKDVYEPTNTIKKFIPITNDLLNTYSGGSEIDQYYIKRLIVDSSQKNDAGLFAQFEGDRIEYVTLINEQIKGSSRTANGSIGGLVGFIPTGGNEVTIEGCQLYMDEDGMTGSTPSDKMTDAKSNWMNGAKNIGGLVGLADREVDIKLSSASTVITGASDYAGGLVGKGAKVAIDKSYADCYIGGKNIGGLMGSCDSTSTIHGSYSAGFVIDPSLSSGGKIAGMTPSAVSSAIDSYTVFHFGAKNSYDNSVAFYTTVGHTAYRSSLYYVPAGFDIPTENKIGSDRSSSNMKDPAKTGFSAGLFAFRSETAYGFTSSPYKLTDQTTGLVGYTFPMIIRDEADKKTLNHYGDWHDSINYLTVRFLYSQQALELRDAGEIELTSPLYETSSGSGIYYFTEDRANAIVAHQEIQEYTNAFIPQQNYELVGREKAVLYWEFTYEGDKYYYVPDSTDSYWPADNGPKYRGHIYKASDCEENITAGNVAPWNGVTPAIISNPLESVSQAIDVYARFYMTDTIQFVRLYYKIYSDSTRTSATGRYIGRADVVKDGDVYKVTTEAHSNVGGYHFYGWAETANGWYENDPTRPSYLSSAIAQEHEQTLYITASTIEKGDIYAIYERIDSYPVNVEYCAYDSNNNGWGSSIYQPQYNTYSTEDWIGGNGTRNIYLPKTADVVGYDLHKYNNTNDYKALYFKADGNRDASKDADIRYDILTYASLTDALAAGGAYVTIDITASGTYVVPYKGQGQRNYRIDKYYLDTASSGSGFTYQSGQTKTVTGQVYDDGVVGSNISSDKLEPADNGYELAYYGNNHTPLIGNVADGETYVCQVYYKRKQYELFYDLNGSVWNDSGTTKGYHTFDEVAYGQPFNNVQFINDAITTANDNDTTNDLLNMSGCVFGGWTYYEYDQVVTQSSYADLTAYSGDNMPNEAVIAVATWYVGPDTPVKLEVYRESREDKLEGTSFDNLLVPNNKKTYLLQQSLDITSAVNGSVNANDRMQRKEKLYNAPDYATLKNLITSTYANAINGLGNQNDLNDPYVKMYKILTGKETQYYFTDAVTTNPLLQWATIKPEIVNGQLVIRLYYDRAVITTILRYGSASGQTAEQRDRNTANANAETDKRITVGTYRTNNRNYNQISMKALYGAHFDEPPYVWTDEYFFQYGSGNNVSGKRHLESFIDAAGSIGDGMGANSRTTWTFTYSSTNGNTTVNAYLEPIDGSGTDVSMQVQGTTFTYKFDKNNALYKYTYLQSANTNNYFMEGNFHGYTLWAKQYNNGTLTEAQDSTEKNKVQYNNNNYNNFYFIRLSGLKLNLNDAKSSTTHLAFDPYVARYKDKITLPTVTEVEHPTDPTKYTFGGWYTSSDFTGDPITEFTMDDHDAIVYAKWIPVAIELRQHAQYPDSADTATANFTTYAQFGKQVTSMYTLEPADNARIINDPTGIYYRYTPAGDDRPSTYRFDGWWRKDSNDNYTVRLTGSEVLYGDAIDSQSGNAYTDVYARWTQIEGYAYLKYRCIRVDDTTQEHVEMSTSKILLGNPQHIYAPLVNAATWGAEWTGYYPTQTRITTTFTGDEPEIVFYYSKGTALNYRVNYYVTFKPYTATPGNDEEVQIKTQEYIQSVNTAVVVPPSFEGYIIRDDITSVTVTSAESGKIINFYYEPDLRTIQMVAKEVYGSHQSFPEIVIDDINELVKNTNYSLAIQGYELVPMYKFYDLSNNEITPDYILASEKDTYLKDLPDGTYRAKGRVYLRKNGVDLLVLWESPNYINFMMVNTDETITNP